MLLASINKNVNFSYVLEINTLFVILNETFYGIFQTWSPNTNWPILGCPFVFINNFSMLPFSFQTSLLGCNSEGLKELSGGSESAKIKEPPEWSLLAEAEAKTRDKMPERFDDR